MSVGSGQAGDSAVTALDLALYAEGLLDAAGCERVERLLEQHPQLRECCAEWSDGRAAVERPRSFLEDERVRSAGTGLSDVSKRRTWVSPAAAVLLLVTAIVVAWRNTEAGAFEAALKVTENVLHSDGARLPIELQRSRQSLERLQKSFWISDQQMRRRNRLLAESILAQVGMELKHVMPLDFVDRPDKFPPLELCGQAVSLLSQVTSDDKESRQVLAEAFQSSSEIRGRLAAVQRFKGNLRFLDQYALSAAAALDGLRAAPDSRLRLALLDLLFRAVHKGALTGGLPSPADGLVSAESILLPQLQRLIQELSAGSSSWSGSDWNELAVPLGMAISRLPVDSYQDRLAMMGVCNTLGMRLRTDPEQSGPVLRQGILLAEQVTGAEQDLKFQLTYGRLLGNLADTMTGAAELHVELQLRERAVEHFRSATRRIISEELQSELCWVTARQLLLLYVAESQGLQPASRVDEYLGALKQITDNLTSFEGAQLSLFEIELIRAIYADREADLSLGMGLVQAAEAAVVLSRNSAAVAESHRRLYFAFRKSPYCNAQPEFAGILRAFGIE
ncbi:MAG: hypothetical protein ACKO3T_20090 [Planctomycetaceae bacterium]